MTTGEKEVMDVDNKSHLITESGCINHGSHIDCKMGKHFPVREKSGNFEQTGKSGNFTQNTGKLRQL